MFLRKGEYQEGGDKKERGADNYFRTMETFVQEYNGRTVTN